MKLNHITKLLQLSMNKKARDNFIYLHKEFRKNKDYKLKFLVRCSQNVIKNERLIKHDGSYIVNSFIPPLNSRAFESIGKSVPGEGADFYKNHISGVRSAPISVYIAVTGRCMYNCWHCSASSMMDKQEADLSTALMQKIIKDVQDLGVGIIGFTGGEPLIREDLEQLISSVDERSMTLLFTNGYELSRERAQKLKAAGLFGIAISVDSTKEEVHDQKRGYKGAYNIAMQAIQNAQSAGLYTMGQVVCTKEMLKTGEIHEVAKQLQKKGIHELRIVEPIPCGLLEGCKDEILTLEEKKQLIALHILFNSDKAYPKTSVFPYIESEDQYGCGAGVQHSYIDTQGEFRPCDFIYENYGNILKEPIKGIWERMHTVCGKPKCECYAKTKGSGECHKSSRAIIPKYYRLLGGTDGNCK